MKNNFKSYKNKFSLFLSALFLFQLILFNTNTAFAATTTSVSYTVTGEAKVGNTIEIAVNISNVTDLYGGSIDFIYDTSLLEIQSVTKGNIFGSNEVLTPLGTNGKIQNGQASFAISIKGNKPGVTLTSGNIAIIKAKVLKEGTVKLNTTSENTPSLSLKDNTIRVKLANSNSTYIPYTANNKSISLINSLSITLNANKTNSTLGEAVTFTANSNLGTNAQYGFYVNIDGTWNLIQSYSSKNTLTYTAPKAGNYIVRAFVRDKNNTSTKAYKDITFTVTNKLALTSLTASKTNSSLGEAVTFTANSNIGANAQYGFYVQIDGAWKLIQSYSSKNTFTYTAPKAGTYLVRAFVRDKNNTSTKAYKDVSFTVTNKLALTSLTASKTNSSLGEAVTFTANSNIGANAQYGFYVQIDGAWKLIQSYSSKNTFTYTAPKAGTYLVRAFVRDKNNTSTKAYKDVSFTVTNKLALTSLTASKTNSSLGEAVTFTANSNIGANAQYGFYVQIDGVWKLIQSYSSKNTFTYTAPKAGTYLVRAFVRDKNNTSIKAHKDVSFTVTNKLALTSLTASKTNSSLGEAVTFTANSNIGANAQYGFYVQIDGAWKLIQSYSSKNTFTYTAPKAGTYLVRAFVRDKNNTSIKAHKDVSFTVTN